MTADLDLWLDEDTIAALSTPPGIGALAVVRISGPRAVEALRRCAPGLPTPPPSRRPTLVRLVAGGISLDRGMVTVFPAPRSYTGEDVVEISLHGAPVLADRLLEELARAGIRAARPGEFTLRAFRNGRMDLIQAEAVNRLVNARTLEGARLAFSALEGGLSRRVRDLRRHLVELGAVLETEIEFVDDEQPGRLPALEAVRSARREIRNILENSRFNEILGRGLAVVIAGRVNAGKSTLFNALLGYDRALVSPRPGTTRDYLTETIYVDGFPVDLTDVAGWDEVSRDELEARGIRWAADRLAAADMVLFVVDASRETAAADREVDRMTVSRPRLVVAAKMDVADRKVVSRLRRRYSGESYCEVSAVGHTGLEKIRDFLSRRVREARERELDFAVSARQRSLLRELEQILERLCGGIEANAPATEILAEELRRGLDCIGRLAGDVTTDEILDTVFSRFCIGK